MVVRMNDPKINDYDIFCDNCGSEEICDHEFGIVDLQSVDYCEECCPKCEAENDEGDIDAEREMQRERNFDRIQQSIETDSGNTT
jgi:hypothetical protein|tara:strand:+ start:563 stop:817 length:255 start_codon:yes stop_codon:yes gene_type:complete